MEFKMTIEEAREIAREAWKGNKGICRIRCLTCFTTWKAHRNGPEPPVWPPNYEGKDCPLCGAKLPKAGIPL